MRLAWICVFVLAGCTEHGSGGPNGNPDGGVVGKACGGLGGDVVCPGDQFCDFGRNGCGATDEQGTCKARPTSCDDNLSPVCGCDNQMHPNECDANASGNDVNAFGNCQTEAGKFGCGFRQCSLADEFCHVFGNDIGNEPDDFVCTPTPSCTGHEGCDCLQSAGVACADQCQGDGAIGLTVTCFGG